MDFTLAYYYANLIHFIFSEATADSIPIGAYLYMCWMRGVGLDMQARIQGGQNTGRPDGLPVLNWGGGFSTGTVGKNTGRVETEKQRKASAKDIGLKFVS